MVKTTDLVAAVRCSSQAPTPSPPCATCAYRVVELLDGKEYTSCDCDRMGMDAADRTEELVDRCARYAEEIAVLQDRIAAYEDSRCAPEEVLPKDEADEITMKLMRLADLESLCSYTRLRELAEADKDGRVVVLPCKVGDRLYEVTGRKTISVYKVRAIRVELFGLFIEWDIVDGFVWQSLAGINAGEIGKTVFLTHEEAKQALEAMKDG